jgi:hypothetical protein
VVKVVEKVFLLWNAVSCHAEGNSAQALFYESQMRIVVIYWE